MNTEQNKCATTRPNAVICGILALLGGGASLVQYFAYSGGGKFPTGEQWVGIACGMFLFATFLPLSAALTVKQEVAKLRKRIEQLEKGHENLAVCDDGPK